MDISGSKIGVILRPKAGLNGRPPLHSGLGVLRGKLPIGPEQIPAVGSRRLPLYKGSHDLAHLCRGTGIHRICPLSLLL